MKTIVTLLALAITITLSAQQKSQVAFTLKEKDLIPEGIAYDPASKAFFVSSIFKRKIVRINSKGEASDFITTGQDSVLEVLGMKVDDAGKLWACNNTPEHDTTRKVANIHVFDLKSGKLLKRHTISDGTNHLFNDIYFMSNGDAYITDSEGGSVYRVPKGGELELFFPKGKLQYPNGITATSDEKKLVVASGGLGFVTIDLDSKELKQLRHPKYFLVGTDGLYLHGGKLIGIQNVLYPEAVLRFTPDSAFAGIEKIETLTVEQPGFDMPTTGVIVGNEFYFIANSQLLQLGGQGGQLKKPQTLSQPLIMKIKLN